MFLWPTAYLIWTNLFVAKHSSSYSHLSSTLTMAADPLTSSSSSAQVIANEGTSSMEETFDKLAQHTLDRLVEIRQHTNNPHERLWIGLAGAPGSGKTTVGESVVKHIHQKTGKDCAICLPMDGYHIPQQHLHELGMDMKRRGSPWTFDAEAMTRDLSEARKVTTDQETIVDLPSYDREISDPRPGGLRLLPQHEIVIVEGNYVLLGYLYNQLQELKPGEELPEQVQKVLEITPEFENNVDKLKEEAQRWKPMLDDLWQETWFVAPPDGFPENKRRLVGRSLKTWNPEKTKLWSNKPGETDRQAATNRVDYNDSKNGELAICAQPFADIMIETK